MEGKKKNITQVKMTNNKVINKRKLEVWKLKKSKLVPVKNETTKKNIKENKNKEIE